MLVVYARISAVLGTKIEHAKFDMFVQIRWAWFDGSFEMGDYFEMGTKWVIHLHSWLKWLFSSQNHFGISNIFKNYGWKMLNSLKFQGIYLYCLKKLSLYLFEKILYEIFTKKYHSLFQIIKIRENLYKLQSSRSESTERRHVLNVLELN